MKPRFVACTAVAALLLGGCVSVPTGPAVMVLPGSNKTFEQFQLDDLDCRRFANAQVGGSTTDSIAADSGVKSAVIGTAIGAVAGGLIGGSNGAAIGAGSGLIIGGATGAGAAGSSQYSLQRRYDVGYQQCMYAKGHKVPMAGELHSAPARRSAAATIPPPPPGTPPPPPPGAN